MSRTIIFLTLISLVVTSGCSLIKEKTGIPVWNSNEASNTEDRFFTEAIGAILYSSVRGRLLRLDQGITILAPSELHSIIIKELSRTSEATGGTPTQQSVIGTNQLNHDSVRVKDINFWGIAETTEGEVTTNWVAIPGRVAGLLWWKKEYLTQVRHIITIRRALTSSTFSGFSITTEVRERPNANYDWRPGDPEHGRRSFEKIRELLVSAIREHLVKKN